uniref:hypothetical protein n=1 Tax=uncultured Caulobacter sp. TaxID=158749 RepID=UPI0025F8D8D6|nr:hypothetical protein [uncultured Caulobacter sp.]
MANKIITTVGRVAAGVAALSLVAAAATTASAEQRYGYRDHRGGNTAATAVAAGIVGLAVGAAISDGNRRDRGYYNNGYYNNGYYNNGYGNNGYGNGYYNNGYYAPPPPPAYGYGYGYAPRPYNGGHRGRDCWTTREYDRWNGGYYERRVCR